MEVTGLNEATQLVNITINGTETALKLSGNLAKFTLEELKTLFRFIHEKYLEYKVRPDKILPGEKNVTELMKYCAENKESVGVIEIDDSLKDEFIEFANENKLAYSTLPKTENSINDMSILYKESDSALFQSFVLQHEKARVSSIESYMTNITVKDMIRNDEAIDRYNKFLKELDRSSNLNNQQIVNNDVEIMQKENATGNKTIINLNKEQITGADTNVCEVRLSDSKFIEIPRESLLYNGKNFYLAIEQNCDYKSYSETTFTKNSSGQIVRKDNITDNGSVKGSDIDKLIEPIKNNDNVIIFRHPKSNTSKQVIEGAEKVKELLKNTKTQIKETINNVKR